MHARLQSSAAPAGHRQQHTAVVQQARPMRTRLSCNASIVSRGNLPDEFKEHNGFKLQFVVFSRLTPDHSTATLQPHLPEHEAWLKGLGDKLAFHGPFLNAEVCVGVVCVSCACRGRGRQQPPQGMDLKA
jgi:hypothetical protein